MNVIINLLRTIVSICSTGLVTKEPGAVGDGTGEGDGTGDGTGAGDGDGTGAGAGDGAGAGIGAGDGTLPPSVQLHMFDGQYGEGALQFCTHQLSIAVLPVQAPIAAQSLLAT